MDNKSKNKIPEGAKRVFQGVLFEVYQWEQKMFDGSVATYERAKRRNDTNAIIATVGDKVIVLEQEQPFKGSFLSLPGGRLEDGEESSLGAKRELLEETGHMSDDFFPWKTFHPASAVIWNNYYFIARNCKFIQDPTPDNGEKIKMRLVTFDELIMLSENEKFRHHDLKSEFLHMRLHPEKQKEFKKLLFGE